MNDEAKVRGVLSFSEPMPKALAQTPSAVRDGSCACEILRVIGGCEEPGLSTTLSLIYIDFCIQPFKVIQNRFKFRSIFNGSMCKVPWVRSNLFLDIAPG